MGIISPRSKQRSQPTSDDLRLDDYPPPYPDGWYRLMNSKSLRHGQVRYLECLGRALVVWRNEDTDDIHAMGAFCPHLGANLAYGRVRKDCIECPFHRWLFTGEGQAVSIPYSHSLPSRVLTESFPVEEVHGQIFLYHRGGGVRQQASDKVPYRVPRFREVDDGSFVFRGHYDGGRVRTHIIELVENAPDYKHFDYVHNQMYVPWTQIPVPGLEVKQDVTLELNDDRPWEMLVSINSLLKAFGRRLERTKASTQVTYTGAGSVITFRVTMPGIGEVLMYLTQLPVAPLEQQIDFRWFAGRKVPRILVWYLVSTWITQISQDAHIFESKSYVAPPILCREDGPVGRVRHWYKQFFPEA